MRLRKWMLLIVYIFFFLSFGYLSFSEFMDKDSFWVLWGLVTLGMGYQIISFLVKKKEDGWNSTYVVADDRIFRKIINSLALSYVFMLGFLLIGTIGLYNGFISGHPVNIMVGAIISSLLVFMISQIVQRFIG
ncbi:hypothetical protein [Oceanobacillus halotolerans]|uniref:hypothetical protein n=1 Tax=Oceanobacillus halotolerans TaxID=2663380 RepID=UPI0013DC865D|nr:hypothetical protein [Oceanobacillus halotolerans]